MSFPFPNLKDYNYDPSYIGRNIRVGNFEDRSEEYKKILNVGKQTFKVIKEMYGENL